MPPPDSLQALWKVTAYTKSKGSKKPSKQTIKGILFAKPYKNYRINWLGPFNIPVGSFSWNPDKWKLKVPMQGLYQEGIGDQVPILGTKNVQSIPIHTLIEFMWNGYLQQELYPFFDTETSKDSTAKPLYITEEDLYVQIHFDSTRASENSGKQPFPIVETVFMRKADSEHKLTFEKYHNTQNYFIPRRVEIYDTGVLKAVIEVSAVKINPKWKKSPF